MGDVVDQAAAGTPRGRALALAGLVWLGGWTAMFALDGSLDLANLALVLVLTSALASLWLPGWAGPAAGALAVLGFNWAFVPPRHEFAVDLRQHALLLVAMLAVSSIVSALVARQRRLARTAERHAERERRLRAWGDTLRDAPDPVAYAGALREALGQSSAVPVALTVLTRLGASADDPSTVHVGEADADQRAGMAVCLRDGQALGPGTGRCQEQPDGYLPLRGRGVCLGAAVLRGLGERADADELRGHLQALCDQMGTALQRALADREERQARDQAQAQGVRNALLAAISHDYRTPLATILGAATSLSEQADRLDIAQRRRLASSIADEAQRLSRLTDNALQLARLDAPGVRLRCDWESAEEIVGAVLRRTRRRPEGRRLKAHLEPGLPLLWCDALLVSQLLENLVDNGLKYSPAHEPVELLVRRVGAQVMLAVRDRGPGIAPAWRERVFEVFQRGDDASRTSEVESARAGAGVGLAVCRAIARAHGGELRLRARSRGGCAFEFMWPVKDQPQTPAPDLCA